MVRNIVLPSLTVNTLRMTSNHPGTYESEEALAWKSYKDQLFNRITLRYQPRLDQAKQALNDNASRDPEKKRQLIAEYNDVVRLVREQAKAEYKEAVLQESIRRTMVEPPRSGSNSEFPDFFKDVTYDRPISRLDSFGTRSPTTAPFGSYLVIMSELGTFSLSISAEARNSSRFTPSG